MAMLLQRAYWIELVACIWIKDCVTVHLLSSGPQHDTGLCVVRVLDTFTRESSQTLFFSQNDGNQTTWSNLLVLCSALAVLLLREHQTGGKSEL